MPSSRPPSDEPLASTKPERPKKKKAAGKKARPTFEESLNELERIVRDLEGGELGLSDALARYEQGVKCLKLCFEQLEQAERRVQLLKDVDEEGNAVTEPFDDRELDLEEKAASRGQRRSASRASDRSKQAPGGSSGVDDSTGLF